MTTAPAPHEARWQPRRQEPRRFLRWDAAAPRVELADRDGGRRLPATLDDLSPGGAGLVADVFPWATGEEVHLLLVQQGGATLELPAIVAHRTTWVAPVRAGLRLARGAASGALPRLRFAASPEVPATAWCDHPWFHAERMLFRVAAFSAQGMSLVPAQDHPLLFEGVALALTVALPGVGERRVIGRVLHAGPGRVEIGWAGAAGELVEAIGAYLLATHPRATIAALRDAGLPVRTSASALTFSYARGADELDEILRLRLLANQASGRLLDVTDPQRTRDPFDARARHVAIRMRGELAGCVRLVVTGGDRSRSELEGIHPLPPELWADGFTEVTRLCVLPELRGCDVFAAALGFLFLQWDPAAHGRFYAANCYPEMAGVYARAGATVLPGEHWLPFSRSRCRFIVFDMPAVRAGGGAEPAVWERLYGAQRRFLERHGRAS